jgi:Effector-associated domain 2
MPTTSELHTVSMETAWKNNLVEALLRCWSMSERDGRNTVVSQLPEALRQNIPRSVIDRVDIINIVTRCEVYPQGLIYLVESIRLVEGDSPALQDMNSELTPCSRNTRF